MYSITRPKKQIKLKAAGGVRKFQAVRVRREIREFVVYAPESHRPLSMKEQQLMGKKNKGNAVTDDELAELESLEDVVDTDEPAEEKPAAKAGKKGKGEKKGKNKDKAAVVDEDDSTGEDSPKKKKSTGAAPGKSRAAQNGKIGTAEIAAKGGTDARTLRMVLRKLKVQKSEETGRYEWDSWDDKVVKSILKELKGGAAEQVKQEGLQRLKDQKAAKDAAKKTADAGEAPAEGKKAKKGKKDKKNKS